MTGDSASFEIKIQDSAILTTNLTEEKRFFLQPNTKTELEMEQTSTIAEAGAQWGIFIILASFYRV